MKPTKHTRQAHSSLAPFYPALPKVAYAKQERTHLNTPNLTSYF